jgi:hypothetical protein
MSKISKKSVEGFSALPILLAIGLVAIGLLFLKEQLKPVPVTPPMYKVGECGKNSVNPDSEVSHEADKAVFKILAVGKKNYQYLVGGFGDKKNYATLIKQPIAELDPGTEKTECPKELNDPKTLEKARNER